ncbi:MAG: IMP dehydrogenase [Bacillota bacterium]
MKPIKEALTFDDVLLVPNYSEVLPSETELTTKLTKSKTLNIPILSSAMDTVSESAMAIVMAKVGGIGFIHKNLSREAQADMVKTVKNHPVNPPQEGETNGYANAVTDSKGRLLCGAAVGVARDTLDRVQTLVDAEVDIITVDSAHGHSKGVIDMVRTLKTKHPDLDIIAGNIVTGNAAKALIDAGADALKVGVGPGSICTTRVIAGIGMPQVSAVMDVYALARAHGIPVIADGGIKFSGDIAKALAAGADTVMLGSLLAGCEESPGELIVEKGQKYKVYQGMGSLAAMKRGSSDRYFQNQKSESKKLVPEGIEGRVSYKGKAEDVLYQLTGGLRSSMGYQGARTIQEMKEKASFVKISQAGYSESHPHTVVFAKKAPNYQ